MNIVVWAFAPVKADAMVASTRLAWWLANDALRLKGHDVFLEWGSEALRHKKIDVLVCVNGAYVFCKYLAVLAELILRAKRIVWIQQDYFIRPPSVTSNGVSPFRAAIVKRHKQRKPDIDLWTTLHSRADDTEYSRYINWNKLAYDITLYKRYRSIGYRPTLFYYGAWRDACNAVQGRGGKNTRYPYFVRYFTAPPIKTVISSASNKFSEHFKHKNIEYIPQLQSDVFHATLAQQGLGLYIEDRKSHGGDTSPATRFYEMLSVGLPMVFQPEAIEGLTETFSRVGMVPAIEKNLKNVMRDRKDIAAQQRKAWASTDYRAELHADVRRLWRAYLKGI